MKNAKKWLGLLLALVLVCSLLPVGALTALAEGEGETPAEPQEPTAYNLWIGGLQVTDETLSGEGWRYDPASKTLTLTDAKITAASTNTHSSGVTCTYVVYARGIDLTVSLSGVNTLGDGSADYTIMSDEGTLTIKGGGSLTAAAGSYSALHASKSISITGSTVTATSNGMDAIFADTSVTITDSTVTATGSRNGIVAVMSSITISGNSAVTVEGGNGAFFTEGGVILNDGLEYIEGSADAKKAVIEPTPTYTVTVSAEPAEGGSVTADPASGTEGTEISLTATPKLPAPTVENITNCYMSMFEGCSSLTNAYVKAAYKNGVENECLDMFKNCTAAGAKLHTKDGNQSDWNTALAAMSANLTAVADWTD